MLSPSVLFLHVLVKSQLSVCSSLIAAPGGRASLLVPVVGANNDRGVESLLLAVLADVMASKALGVVPYDLVKDAQRTGRVTMTFMHQASPRKPMVVSRTYVFMVISHSPPVAAV